MNTSNLQKLIEIKHQAFLAYIKADEDLQRAKAIEASEASERHDPDLDNFDMWIKGQGN